MPYYTVIAKRTVWQEVKIEEVEANTPEEAKKIANDEIHKYYLRLEKTFDVDEVDSDFTIDLEDVKENVDSGNEPAQ